MKALLILGIAAFLLTPLVIFVFLPKVKRKKLAQAWSDQTKVLGVPVITVETIKKELDKVTNSDINTLIKWSKALQAKDYALAGKMFNEVNPVLAKMDLGIINKILPK